MKVLKFGGTSVGNAEAIRRVAGIIQRSLPDQPLVVSSAVGGVTNRLFWLVEKALDGGDWQSALETVIDVHREIIEDLELDVAIIEPLLGDLEDLVRGVSLIRECTPRLSDYLVSFGERLAVRILAACLTKAGTPARALDSFDVGLITDSRFGAARPVADVESRIRDALADIEEVPIVTGYIGKNEAGEITTLGRGGSDYTAAIYGAALGADEIQIWTDVDGVMTADPKIVEGAKFLEKLSFAEAAELAFYGAKVIHPATLIPAVENEVPIRVLNSYRPEFEGTLIVPDLQPSERGLKSIASKDHVKIISVVAEKMFLQYGFIERIARVFARYEIVIDMIATTEISVSMTTDPSANLDPVVEELSMFARVSVERGFSQVSIVGEEIAERIGFAAEFFAAIAALGVNVEMISFGATRNNLSVVVTTERVGEIVEALHQKFFGA